MPREWPQKRQKDKKRKEKKRDDDVLPDPVPNVFILHPAAAQKLSGKVRIANVGYLESFRNASSKEYRAFLELFLRTVSGWNWSLFSPGMKRREVVASQLQPTCLQT